jgi:[ribosomal protein S18]-alanine N-acetyltransferase
MLVEKIHSQTTGTDELIQKISELDLICFPTLHWSLEQLKSHTKNHTTRYIEVRGRIVSFLLTLENAWESEILKIGTHPDYHRKKYAVTLIQHHIESCMEKDIFLEVEESNLPAINFYVKMGFQLLDKRKAYYQNGSDALVYRKEKTRT